jgi:hypothetical protein
MYIPVPTLEPEIVLTTSTVDPYDMLEDFLEFLLWVYGVWALYYTIYTMEDFLSWAYAQLCIRNRQDLTRSTNIGMLPIATTTDINRPPPYTLAETDEKFLPEHTVTYISPTLRPRSCTC